MNDMLLCFVGSDKKENRQIELEFTEKISYLEGNTRCCPSLMTALWGLNM